MKKCFNNIWQFSLIVPPTSSRLHQLQVENCDSNSRLVVSEDINGKFSRDGLKTYLYLQPNKVETTTLMTI